MERIPEIQEIEEDIKIFDLNFQFLIFNEFPMNQFSINYDLEERTAKFVGQAPAGIHFEAMNVDMGMQK